LAYAEAQEAITMNSTIAMMAAIVSFFMTVLLL
jgi:hypothetical protein